MNHFAQLPVEVGKSSPHFQIGRRRTPTPQVRRNDSTSLLSRPSWGSRALWSCPSRKNMEQWQISDNNNHQHRLSPQLQEAELRLRRPDVSGKGKPSYLQCRGRFSGELNPLEFESFAILPPVPPTVVPPCCLRFRTGVERSARCLLGVVVSSGRLNSAREEKEGATDYKARRPPWRVGGEKRWGGVKPGLLKSNFEAECWRNPRACRWLEGSGGVLDAAPELLLRQAWTHKSGACATPPCVFSEGLPRSRACPWKAEAAAATVSLPRGVVFAAMSGGFELQPLDGGPRVALAPGETVIGRGPLLRVSVAGDSAGPREPSEVLFVSWSPVSGFPTTPALPVWILEVGEQHVFQ